ncbi:ferritin-like metal-binding protein YciE [Chitinophaga skermanii]|uniref:Ferritin-like metal-binding protein YciE n=1 Tax=Chitinophaga skermanii TaxID=331697 RepID=A0A327Q6T4_9BACT|nr:DUF892 family protein [Chitinophaga skermanii]RAJ00286.1 ferritin-like metal-binding protein YciE [Chitinophaga skermanii]
MPSTHHHTGLHEGEVQQVKLLLQELKSLYWVVKKISRVLDLCENNAQSIVLSQAFANFSGETILQRQRIEEVFAQLAVQPGTIKMPAIAQLIDEGMQLLEGATEHEISDPALTLLGIKLSSAIQANYFGVCYLCDTLHYTAVEELLELCYHEIRATAQTFATLAFSKIDFNFKDLVLE